MTGMICNTTASAFSVIYLSHDRKKPHQNKQNLKGEQSQSVNVGKLGSSLNSTVKGVVKFRSNETSVGAADVLLLKPNERLHTMPVFTCSPQLSPAKSRLAY